jgi:hypothetical protein
VSPPLADRELEDAAEVGVKTADGLRSQTGVEAGVEEALNVVRQQLAERGFAEVRLEVDPDL